MILFDYQERVKQHIYSDWEQHNNVLGVMPTGAGKTALFTNIMSEFGAPSVAIAHRSELVCQMSLALARNGVQHSVVGTKDLVRECIDTQIKALGRSYYNASSKTAVAAVATLVKRANDFNKIGLWVTDEAHHLLKTNIWGKAVDLFPNAKGLGVTATPMRADGKGLGRHADGVFDTLVVGPTMRELINRERLCDYKIYAPQSKVQLDNVPISSGGDYSLQPLRDAVHKSKIVGDTVDHYLKLAPGKIALTFTVDISSAEEQAAAYRLAGVPSEAISGTMGSYQRASILARLARGDIKQVVSCDLISEGFDLPACEAVSFCRPTKSYGLFVQQFGRMLRVMPGKQIAIGIDHVNVFMDMCETYGMPDTREDWTLDRAERRSTSKTTRVVQMRVCPVCTAAYERVLGPTCPYCETHMPPVARRTPQQVDGDLYELDLDALAKLSAQVDAPVRVPYGAKPEVIGYLNKQHRKKTEAQKELRDSIALWAGRHSTAQDEATVRMLQRKFYIEFGVDVLTAQTLNESDALKLNEEIKRA